MESDQDEALPLRKQLSYKFLLSTTAFIVLIEAVLLLLSIYGYEARLFELRQMLATKAKSLEQITPTELLPNGQVYDMAQTYARNILMMVAVIVVVVITGIYFLLRHWILQPIQLILEKNSETQQDGSPELIPEAQIPDDEIGQIMRSRNQMLTTLKELFDEEVIEMLVKTVDAKDEYTRGHSRRVGQLGRVIGRKMDLSSDTLDKLEYSGLLHDLGKIGLSDEILTADRGLTEEEFERIKDHPVKGADIVGYNSFPDEVIEGIRHHHERYDGEGYPDGLAGDEIPLFGRILGVADAVDAMLSTRHYRQALGLDETIHELESNAGDQFDPAIADHGIEVLERDEHQPIFERVSGPDLNPTAS